MFFFSIRECVENLQKTINLQFQVEICLTTFNLFFFRSHNLILKVIEHFNNLDTFLIADFRSIIEVNAEIS